MNYEAKDPIEVMTARNPDEFDDRIPNISSDKENISMSFEEYVVEISAVLLQEPICVWVSFHLYLNLGLGLLINKIFSNYVFYYIFRYV